MRDYRKVVMALSQDRVKELEEKYPEHLVIHFTCKEDCWKLAGVELSELIMEHGVPYEYKRYLYSRLHRPYTLIQL